VKHLRFSKINISEKRYLTVTSAIIIGAAVTAGVADSNAHQARKGARTAADVADKKKAAELRKAESAEAAAQAEADKKILLRKQGQTQKVFTQGLGSFSPVVGSGLSNNKTKTLG